MNKVMARRIAKSGKITYGQIKAMLKAAYDAGAANEKRSRVNKTCSKAVAFNIFWNGHKTYKDDAVVVGNGWMGAYNALREFGEYWNGYTPEKPKKPTPPEEYYHEEPVNPH